jgi:hypothetical protein
MTSFASLLNIPMLIMGLIGYILLVVLLEQQKELKGPNYWRWNSFTVLFLFGMWGVLSTLIRFLIYTGGTIEEIYFKDAIADVVAYAITIGFAYARDKKEVPKIQQPRTQPDIE